MIPAGALSRRILSLASDAVTGYCALLAVVGFVVWLGTRHAALMLVNDSTFTEVTAYQGSLYWRSDCLDRYTGEPGDLQGFLLMNRHWAPPDGAPPPSARRLGFARATFRAPNQFIARYLRGPVTTRLTIVPLWFILSAISLPPAVRLARRYLPRQDRRTARRGAVTEHQPPAGDRVGMKGRPARAGLILFLIAAAGWCCTADWHDYGVQWMGPEWAYSIRSKARQGCLEIASEQVGYERPGSDRYASTGWQLNWNWYAWPPRFRDRRLNELHLFPWFRAVDVIYARGLGHEWAIPYWFLLLVAAVRPALWLTAGRRHDARRSLVFRLLLCDAGLLWLAARYRQRSRAAAGSCEGCGYDLRASPDRCPECGRSAARAAG